MPENTRTLAESQLIHAESDDRLVVLARTIQARDAESEMAWTAGDGDWTRFKGCLGRALYRHRSVFQGASEAPVWSHLELSYFRGIAPAGSIGCASA